MEGPQGLKIGFMEEEGLGSAELLPISFEGSERSCPGKEGSLNHTMRFAPNLNVSNDQGDDKNDEASFSGGGFFMAKIRKC